MNRRLLLLVGGGLTLLLILLLVALSCAPKKSAKKPGGQQITLTYWRLFDDKEKFDPIIEQYKKTHPNITIEYRKLTAAEYEKTLLEALAAGKGPDMFSLHNDWMASYFDKLAPLPEKDLSTADYQKQYYPAVKDAIKDNRIYGIPYAMDTLGLFVNTELFSKANASDIPKTWDDLVGKAGDPTKPGIISKLNVRQGNAFSQSAIALGNTRVSRAADILSLLMLQQRTTMVNDDHSQALFNLTQKVENKELHLGTIGLEFYSSFANPRTGNYSWNAAAGDSVKAFADGKAVMMVGYAYHVPTVERLNPNLRYSIEPMLQIAGTDPVNYASYWAETVSKNSQHQKEAWDFIRFVSSKEQLRTYTDATQSISARKDVSAGGKLDVLQKQLETATTWYKGDASKADEIFLSMIDQVLGGEDPQRAVDNGANRLTTVLKGLNSGSKKD